MTKKNSFILFCVSLPVRFQCSPGAIGRDHVTTPDEVDPTPLVPPRPILWPFRSEVVRATSFSMVDGCPAPPPPDDELKHWKIVTSINVASVVSPNFCTVLRLCFQLVADCSANFFHSVSNSRCSLMPCSIRWRPPFF